MYDVNLFSCLRGADKGDLAGGGHPKGQAGVREPDRIVQGHRARPHLVHERP